ncbi:MAG: carbohydrate kinase family protein [Anaerolineae bacterium]|nr:carbohydrate kinase family protein [Anaerolineae bacterium]MEB2288234.1 carbohydrate kinase family protein [Anaerolineae bacterium]
MSASLVGEFYVEYDVFLPGDYFYDLIYTGLPEFPMLGREIYGTGIIATGGAMFITATSLRRLGVRVGWAACWGNDDYSQHVRRLAVGEDIDLALAQDMDRPYRRITTSIPFQGERAFVSYADPPPVDLDAHWLAAMRRCDFRHLHLGAMFRLERVAPLVAEARAHGATVSMDCQDVPNLAQACTWQRLLGLVDVFIPNAREALLVSETSAVESALQRLMEWTEVVVVKDGANGAWIGTKGAITHVPAVNAGPAVDTTGAGDCFNAGFLLGYVVEGAPLERCARYANICGGLSVTQVGGATAAPTRAELDAWLARPGA